MRMTAVGRTHEGLAAEARAPTGKNPTLNAKNAVLPS
jgi:hypothetical protein